MSIIFKAPLMNVNIVVFVIISIIAICFALYLQKCTTHFNHQFQNELDANVLKLNNLEKFSYNIYFNPMPPSIDITNPHECTPIDLRPCKVNDFTSCSGCKNLIARCVNFSQDTKFVDADGKVSVIPKNETKEDGYCLVTQNLSTRCNPHHGDMVLVRIEPEHLECVLICECKRPGYVGKTTVDGSCEEAFVCGGKVKELNVPFEQIECVCDEGFQSKTVKGTPVCQIATVQEFKNYNSLHYKFDTLPSSYFNRNVGANFPGDRLKDPCKYCLITGEPVNGEAVPTSDGYACKANDSHGIPIKSGPIRMLKGSSGPDAIIKITWEWIFMYGKVKSPDFNNMAAIFSKSANLEISKKLGLDKMDKEWFAIDLLQHEVRFPGHFGYFVYEKVPMGVCYPFGTVLSFKFAFTYHCTFKTQEKHENSNYRYFDNGFYLAYDGERHPGKYLWNYEMWDSIELDVNPIISIEKEKDGMSQFKLNKYLWGSSDIANDIKLLFLAFRPSEKRIDAVLTTSLDDYKRYKGKLISQTT